MLLAVGMIVNIIIIPQVQVAESGYRGIVIYGDIDNDGDVDQDDQTLLQKYVYGTSIPDESTCLMCDVNLMYGRIDISDISALIDFRNGSPTHNIASGYCGENLTGSLLMAN